MAKNATELQAEAQLWFQRARRQLQGILQPGNRRVFSGSQTRRNDRGAPSPYSGNGIGLQFQAGRDPTDADVLKYIDSIGGNPFLKQLEQLNGAQAQVQESTSTTPPSSYKQIVEQNRAQSSAGGGMGGGMMNDPVFARLFMGAESANAAAKQANIDRYNEAHAGATDLRSRVLGDIDNWGTAQGQLNEEKAAQALDAQRAMLADRGMANTNILPAFAARNARDLALTQQDLSERKSARAIAADTSLTNGLLGIVERRNDTAGMDPNMLMQMAMQYGNSGAGKGFGGDGTGTGIPAPSVIGGSQEPASVRAGRMALENQAFNRRMSKHGAPIWVNGMGGDPVMAAANAFPAQMAGSLNPFADRRYKVPVKATITRAHIQKGQRRRR